MSRLSNLLRQLETQDPKLAADLKREVEALSGRRAFGLNFERHIPETVELPNRPVRRGDKVRFIAKRGEKSNIIDHGPWRVTAFTGRDKRIANLIRQQDTLSEPQFASRAVEDLVVIAEFRDPIYPGLLSIEKVERGGDKPFHSVINAENYHALQVLLYTHEGKIDAIYIDPPYNTGARDWKYNNDYIDEDDAYRHSKWLAMMERRLQLAKRLLNPERSVLIVTIDEKEYLRLGLLLEQVFTVGPNVRTQMVSTNVNPAAVPRGGTFGRSDEYVFFVMLGSASPQRLTLSRDWVSSKGRTHTGNIRWDLLRRSGTNAERSHSPGCFYPIYVDPKNNCIARVGAPLAEGVHQAEQIGGLTAILPIRTDRTEGNWQWAPATLKERMKQGRVKVGGNPNRGFTVYVLKDGEYAKIKRGEFKESGRAIDGSLLVEQKDADHIVAVPSSQWRIPSHDSTQYGTRLLSRLLPGRKFPFPKSLYAVEDALRFFVNDNPKAVILDFFAGSGTTAQAVMRLNKQDGGIRRSILVTNNEISAQEEIRLRANGLRPGDPEWEAEGICEQITKPRITSAVTGTTPEGTAVKGGYKFIDEFPMSEGLEENVEFFNMTYEAPRPMAHNRSFQAIAPLLWIRAGSQGRRIEKERPDFDVADTYAVLFDLDASQGFLDAVTVVETMRIAFIVTDDDRGFQTVCGELPARVEAVRLYESYLTNFTINTDRG